MNKNLKLLTLAAVALALVCSVGCDKLRARDQLNKGVESYKNSHFEQAIDHFQQAVQLDPSLTNARMYLATAYVSLYIPGVDSPDNLRNAQQAIDQYQKVLDDKPTREQRVNSAKADVECDDLSARAEDLKTADHWVDETLRVKKEKADRAAQNPGGVTVDQPK